MKILWFFDDCMMNWYYDDVIWIKKDCFCIGEKWMNDDYRDISELKIVDNLQL